MVDLKVLKQSTIVHLCFAISYFTSGLILNVVQAVLYFGLRPFNKSLYRKINYYLSYSFYSQLVFMSEWWSGTTMSIYIKKDEYEKFYGKEHGYLIMNHSYEIDWLMGWQFCDGIGVLGNCKAYAKKSIQYLPPIGWMWKFSEFVFLERSFEKDKEIIKSQISELCDYPDPVWLLLTPEGTRYTKKKHEASLNFAREKNLPLLKHHLTPRTRGFTTSLQFFRGKIPAIYNIQLAFGESKTPPTLTSLLFGKPVHAHLYIQRIPVESIPEDENEATKWMHDLFVTKDKMQDSFINTGDFFLQSGVERVEPFSVGPRIYSLINTLGWAVVTLTPMLYYLLGLLFSGKLIYFSIAAAVFAAFFILLQKSIGMSKISQGSSYGAEKK
ncbi:1-acyl-sn-glycerol-3-phosphate acyltransferase gamma [Amyelois transitella]|uniref:1-acyl-sn-glycerol-3-phosphate acyltransferase gamma n=1 Tax=Amyelois transitella TaxID=680683 RepID=UPI00067E0798|nr:1-acyl-sn-glycerol-3-phosphate acyltransferase gamma [Amyelois transitella]XP_013188795.1 1-acyl-sn-glycerol-3-phosphate acyltransferase gamma [Amyelois transitella]XP_013188804.1 1-acyl-sn-glycerol-3-phosphate acyltransferase gamma [Amyelois transitella]